MGQINPTSATHFTPLHHGSALHNPFSIFTTRLVTELSGSIGCIDRAYGYGGGYLGLGDRVGSWSKGAKAISGW